MVDCAHCRHLAHTDRCDYPITESYTCSVAPFATDIVGFCDCDPKRDQANDK